MNVTVSRPKTINVRVNQGNQQIVHSTTNFIGSTDVQNLVQHASDVANTALEIALSVSDVANTKYDKTGGHIYGDVIVDTNLTVTEKIFADAETIDAGTF